MGCDDGRASMFYDWQKRQAIMIWAIASFQHCGLSLPIQSIGGKRRTEPRSRTKGNIINFRTRLADFELSYLME